MYIAYDMSVIVIMTHNKHVPTTHLLHMSFLYLHCPLHICILTERAEEDFYDETELEQGIHEHDDRDYTGHLDTAAAAAVAELKVNA